MMNMPSQPVPFVLYPGAERVITKRHAKVLYKVVVLARDAKGSRRCQAVANALVLIYHSTLYDMAPTLRDGQKVHRPKVQTHTIPAQ